MDENDRFLTLAEESIRAAGDSEHYFFLEFMPWRTLPLLLFITLISLGVGIVKYVPTWFPGASYHKEAERVRKISFDIQYEAFNTAKAQLVNFA